MPLFKARQAFDSDALIYFNKVGTPLTDAAKTQVNTLITTMKDLGIWTTCAHGWLYLPEHSGVPAGATTGVFYDLKGVSDLTMTGFAAAGQTQTVNGPHIFENGLRTLRSELLGAVPIVGRLGNTDYLNGEDPGFVWGGLWDEPIDYSTGPNGGTGPSTGSTNFSFVLGGASVFDAATHGSGTLISPTNQYYSRRFRFIAPTTRGMRFGIIGSGPTYFDYPLFIVFDPTASYTFAALDANNLSNNAVAGNTVGCYFYNCFYRLNQAGTVTVPSVRQFDSQTSHQTNESGSSGFSKPPYAALTQSASNGFLIDVGVGTPATTEIRCRAVKINTTNPNEGFGSTPFFFFVFQKDTNFGFRRVEKLVSFHQTLDKQIAGHQRTFNKFAPCPDRCRIRTAKNRTSSETIPPRVYFGVNDSLSTHCNDPANAYGSFTLDMWCEDEEYSLFPASVTSSLTSAQFQTFLLSLQYRIHDGFTKRNFTFPTSPNFFTLGSGTISRNIGMGYKTYRKLCSATYPVTGLHFTQILNVTAPAINAVTTSFTITVSATASPAYAVGSIIRIDDEQMLITAIGGTTIFTVTRGYAGTTAASHVASSNIFIFDPRIRMYNSNPTFINNFEVMATDFNLNYIPTYDADALTYFTNTGITDLTARRQINDFVVAVKALGAWTTMVCWPMRSSQNGTGATVYSLGGGGTFNGTMAAGATWGSEGIIFNGSTGRVSTSMTSITSDHTSMSIFKQTSITGNQVTLAKDDQGSNRQFSHVSAGVSYQGQVFNTTLRSASVGTPVAGAFRSIVLRNSASLTNAQPGQWYSNPTQTTLTSGTMSAGTAGVSIGSTSNSNFFFNGVIPFAAVWNSYLSDTNRATVYRIYRDTLGEGIVLPN